MKNYLYYLLIALPAIIISCNSETSITENETICDCIELDAQRGADGKIIKGRGHIMYYQDSLYTGKCIAYYLDNETKRVELTFKKGLLNGDQMIWDENGNQIFEAPMSQGQIDGTIKEWDEEGHLISHIVTKNNIVQPKGYYYTNNFGKEPIKFALYFKEVGESLGYYYPSFFDDIEVMQNNKLGWGLRIGGDLRYLIKINDTAGDDNEYRLSFDSKKIDDFKDGFFEVLKDFHENNPETKLFITRLSEHGGGFIDATTTFLKFDNFEQISDEFIDFYNELKNFEFLDFHPDLDNLLLEQKRHFEKKSQPKKERELTDFEKEFGKIGFD